MYIYIYICIDVYICRCIYFFSTPWSVVRRGGTRDAWLNSPSLPTQSLAQVPRRVFNRDVCPAGSHSSTIVVVRPASSTPPGAAPGRTLLIDLDAAQALHPP